MASFDFSIKPVEALRNDIDKLTILRLLIDTPPVTQLVNLMNELLSEDSMPFDIQWAYHDFASAVLQSSPSHVTGDRWRDCLIETVLERENAFSLAAAKGRADDTLTRAFARDLGIVHSLFLLDDAMIRNWCTPSQSGMDLSGWVPFTDSSFYIVEGDGPLPTMRRMLLSSEDWSQLAKPLFELHAQFGSGAPLGYRYLQMSAEGLVPIERVNPPGGPANQALLDALKKHGQNTNPGAVFLGGPRAFKTARDTLAVCDLHVVRLQDISQYPLLCERLDGTRTRYAVVLPAPHPADPMLTDLLGEGLSASPDNLLPIALSPSGDPMLEARFPINLVERQG